MQKKIWINWETHRRSQELAKALNLPYYCIDYEGHMLRYPISLFKTLLILIRNSPQVLVVQNPSMILASFACIYKHLFKSFVVVDRHTTFRLNKPHSGSLRIWIFMKLHYWTLKHADLTIVTNNFLGELVKQNGGTPFILPDKLPVFTKPSQVNLSDYPSNLLMISSFGQDEPISDVIGAMSKLGPNCEIRLFISGNYKKANIDLLDSCPENVTMTGYLSEEKYINLLHSVDGVLVLTTSDYCILCGCYEAISAKKPLITSNKQVLKDYFYDAIHVDNNSSAIAAAILDLLENKEEYRCKIDDMHNILTRSWNEHFSRLVDLIAK